LKRIEIIKRVTMTMIIMITGLFMMQHIMRWTNMVQANAAVESLKDSMVNAMVSGSDFYTLLGMFIVLATIVVSTGLILEPVIRHYIDRYITKKTIKEIKK